jgi:hypothetical protein
MTSLAAWIGKDSRKITSIYFVSDSKISFVDKKGARIADLDWPYGKKLFYSKKSEDVFGYCGDVLFPTQIISSIVDLLDGGQLSATSGADCRHRAIFNIIRTFYGDSNPRGNAVIIHGARDGRNMIASFRLWRMDYDSKDGAWRDTEIVLDKDASSIVLELGSGAAAIGHAAKLLDADTQGRTSRSYYWAFCDALKSGKDEFSGGPPQIIGMYSSGLPFYCGTVFDGQRYLWGIPMHFSKELEMIEWRDELFQRINPETLEVLQGAQRHRRK